jgi:hypothetical protein
LAEAVGVAPAPEFSNERQQFLGGHGALSHHGKGALGLPKPNQRPGSAFRLGLRPKRKLELGRAFFEQHPRFGHRISYTHSGAKGRFGFWTERLC